MCKGVVLITLGKVGEECNWLLFRQVSNSVGRFLFFEENLWSWF